MGRAGWIVLLLCSLVAPAWAQEGATIVVNSAADPGEPGDEFVTLREALAFATGAAVPQGGELAGITGAPGRGSPEVIRFDPAVFPPDLPAVISVLGELPALDDAGDSIDAAGAGVVIAGAGVPQNGVQVRATGVRLAGLAITGFQNGVAVTTGGQVDLVDLVLRGNAHGVVVSDAVATVEDSVLVGNFLAGVLAQGAAQVQVVHSLVRETFGDVEDVGDGVRAQDGAQVNIAGSTFEMNQSAVVASGQDTSVTVTGSQIHRHRLTGLRFGAGAQGLVLDSDISDNRHTGVSVGAGASAVVQRSVLANNSLALQVAGSAALEGSTVTGNLRGIQVDQGGRAELRDNDISNNGAGAALSVDGGQVTMNRNTLGGNGLGIVATGGATLELGQNVIAGNHLGVSASGAGTSVTLDGDAVRSHPRSGVEALNQAVVSLHNVQLSDNGTGLLLAAGAMATFRAGAVRANAQGIVVEGAGTSALLDSVSIADSAGDGVLVSGAQATLQGVTLRGNGGAGLRITAGGQVTAAGTTIAANAGGVVLSGEGSQVTLTDSQVVGSAGAGLVLDTGASAQLQRVTVRGNGQEGLVVRFGAAALLAESVVADNRRPVDSAGALVALDSIIDGQIPPVVQVALPQPGEPLVALAPAIAAQVRDAQGQVVARVQFFIFQHTPFGAGRAALLQGAVSGLWIDGLSAEAAAALFPGQRAQLGSIGLVQAYPKVLSQTLRAPGVAVDLVLTDFPAGGLALQNYPGGEPTLAFVAVPNRVRLTVNGAQLPAQAEVRLLDLGPVRDLGQ